MSPSLPTGFASAIHDVEMLDPPSVVNNESREEAQESEGQREQGSVLQTIVLEYSRS